MSEPIRVVHQQDPKIEITKDTQHIVDGMRPLGAGVLIVMYERTKQKGDVKTAGGIIVPDVQHGAAREDKFQGKVGLVMKCGPIAFKEDDHHQWGAEVPQVGDWVAVNVGDTFSFDVPGDRRARIVEDVNVRMILDQPDVVW